MPSPDPSLLQRLDHLSKKQQLRYLDEWSRALMECRRPPPIPKR